MVSPEFSRICQNFGDGQRKHADDMMTAGVSSERRRGDGTL